MWLQHDFTTSIIFAFIKKYLSNALKLILHYLLSGRYLMAVCSVKMKVLILFIVRIHGTHFNLNNSWWLCLYWCDSHQEADYWTVAPSNSWLAGSAIVEGSRVLKLGSNTALPITGYVILGKLRAFLNVHSVKISQQPARL